MNVYDRALQYGLYGLLEGTNRQSNGNTFFVDSSCGENSAGGTWGQSWETPYDTVNYAISKCTTGAGDVILVAAAHAESITATSTASGSSTGQFCIDKGDISIIGMGRGTKRPTFTFTTAAAAGVKLVGTSPNVLLANLIFSTDYTGGLTAIIAAAANCYGLTIENCEFRDEGNGEEYLIGITLASAIEDVTIRGCKFLTTDGGSCTSCIETAGTAPRLQIYDNWFRGDWSTAVLHLDTGHVYDTLIRDNIINNVDAAGLIIALSSSATGAVTGNIIHSGDCDSDPITAVACLIADNTIVRDEGLTGGSGNIVPSQGCVSKTYTNWTAAKHSLFDIKGGPVIVTGLVGVVMATIKATSIDINLDLTPTAPGTDVVLGTVLAIDGDAIGTTYTMNSTFGNILIATTVGGLEHVADNQFVAPIGSITMEGVGVEDGGGSIMWCLSYVALAPGAYVVPASTD